MLVWLPTSPQIAPSPSHHYHDQHSLLIPISGPSCHTTFSGTAMLIVVPTMFMYNAVPYHTLLCNLLASYAFFFFLYINNTEYKIFYSTKNKIETHTHKIAIPLYVAVDVIVIVLTLIIEFRREN